MERAQESEPIIAASIWEILYKDLCSQTGRQERIILQVYGVTYWFTPTQPNNHRPKTKTWGRRLGKPAARMSTLFSGFLRTAVELKGPQSSVLQQHAGCRWLHRCPSDTISLLDSNLVFLLYISIKIIQNHHCMVFFSLMTTHYCIDNLF